MIINMAKKILIENTENELLNNLRAFSRGSMSEEELMEAEPFIKEINVKKPSGNSKIIFDVRPEYFMDEVGLYEEDIWALRCVFDFYDTCELDDIASVEYDFGEGYGAWEKIDEENTKLLKEISESVLPDTFFDLGDGDYKRKLNAELALKFPKITKKLLWEIHHYYNLMLEITMRNDFSEKLDRIYNETGFRLTNDFTNAYTTPAQLILKIRLQTYSGTLKWLVHETWANAFSGDWGSDVYNYADWDNYDAESYNRNLNYLLKEILNLIQEVK